MQTTPRFAEAVALAEELHRTQRRKGTSIPYMAHLLAVAALALEHGADEDVAIGALLHDAVEDQGGPPTLERIRQRFGDRVAGIVAGCTDADVVPKPPWRARKEAYIAHLAEADDDTRLVSSCDKLHNARSILADYREHGEETWARFRGGKEGTLWYYRALVDAFREYGTHPRILDELARVVDELEAESGSAT